MLCLAIYFLFSVCGTKWACQKESHEARVFWALCLGTNTHFTIWRARARMWHTMWRCANLFGAVDPNTAVGSVGDQFWLNKNFVENLFWRDWYHGCRHLQCELSIFVRYVNFMNYEYTDISGACTVVSLVHHGLSPELSCSVFTESIAPQLPLSAEPACFPPSPCTVWETGLLLHYNILCQSSPY